MNHERDQQFFAWWRDDEQKELRKSCAQGWGRIIWNASRDAMKKLGQKQQIMNIDKMLAECRAHWEKTKPDEVFADYWIGWQASRESLSSDLRDAYQKGWDASGEGWNAEHPGDLHEKDNWQLARDESLGLRKNAHL